MNEETDFSTFIKNRITELRCQKGISEYTLSLAIGRSQGYIQSISSGRRINFILILLTYFFWFIYIYKQQFFNTIEQVSPE